MLSRKYAKMKIFFKSEVKELSTNNKDDRELLKRLNERSYRNSRGF